VKLPGAFVYLHVDVTHVDDILFICPRVYYRNNAFIKYVFP
jgi:hypothetical protein